eukprot:TRINITY_DN290_c0_g2_i1.p1 TRINITY_DN290_c0_g2~~TRINITY_DN290_c0_g2_i1.p1  ORF type:complete len:604 (+),score=149.32 TRINITY_DN290_c0_g2_i1:74-1885(+)
MRIDTSILVGQGGPVRPVAVKAGSPILRIHAIPNTNPGLIETVTLKPTHEAKFDASLSPKITSPTPLVFPVVSAASEECLGHKLTPEMVTPEPVADVIPACEALPIGSPMIDIATLAVPVPPGEGVRNAERTQSAEERRRKVTKLFRRASQGAMFPSVKKKDKKKNKFILGPKARAQLQAHLGVFDADKDGFLNLEELTEVRKVLSGRSSAPVVAGDTREILRKYKTRKLAPEQYTAQIANELEEMKRGMAEDALWRIAQASNALAGGKREATQKDFDSTWKRAENLEKRGEVRRASRMYEAARAIMLKIKSTKALGALDEMKNRRTKQDLVHLVMEQYKEKRQLKATGEVPAIPVESPSSTWVLPRGWVEHVLPMGAGRRYYYGLKSGKSVWHRPDPDDFSEDVLAPVKVQIVSEDLQGGMEQVMQEFKTPLVIDQSDGPLVRALKRQQVSFVSRGSSREKLKSELKKAMKFGFLLVFDARFDHGERAVEQFDQLCPNLLKMITCERKELQNKDFFDLLDINSLEKRIFGTGKIAKTFGLVWLQSDLRLPEWGTCDTSVVLQASTEEQSTLQFEDVTSPKLKAEIPSAKLGFSSLVEQYGTN